MRVFLKICAVAGAMVSSLPVSAQELQGLRHGDYVAAVVGCDGSGGAGTMTFDGSNFAGHYQVCRSQKVAGSQDEYSSTCIESQGDDHRTLADIAGDPDKTTERFKLKILSPTSFTKDGDRYDYCGGN